MGLILLEELLESREYKGYNKDEIDKAEERLNIKFPKILKELYIKFGKNNIVNGQQFLIPPKHLEYFSKNQLVFYMENQAVGAWSIKWKNELDEKIIEIYDIDDSGNFKLIEKSLDVFLVKMAITYFNHYLYPNRYTTFELYKKDIFSIIKYYGEPKSTEKYKSNTINYYWNSINDILITHDFEKRPKIYIYSKDENIADQMLASLDKRTWDKLRDETESKKHLERVKRYDEEM